MSRIERAICSGACVAAMLLLWWSFSPPTGWSFWVRIGAVVLVPGTFFGVIVAQLIRETARAEAGLTKEEIKARRRAAADASQRDVFPLLSRPDLYFQPLQRLWELKKQTDKPKRDPRDRPET